MDAGRSGRATGRVPCPPTWTAAVHARDSAVIKAYGASEWTPKAYSGHRWSLVTHPSSDQPREAASWVRPLIAAAVQVGVWCEDMNMSGEQLA